MTEQEKLNVFKVVSAVLHIGNIEFFESEEDAASGSCSVKDPASGVNPAEVASKVIFKFKKKKKKE